ncbi:MAG: hypothetical protein GY696_29285 [Gammaproteobacteria bacterium]|nr:hypothetical protein [Gammaproteobacteria bacterium]
MSNKSTKDPRRKARHNKDDQWKLNKCTGGHNYQLPPMSLDPCAEMKAPSPPSGGKGMCPPPPLPPEGEDGSKGGGEEAQGDLESKKEERGSVQGGRGALQSDDSKQKKFNSEKINTQDRPTVTKCTVHSTSLQSNCRAWRWHITPR